MNTACSVFKTRQPIDVTTLIYARKFFNYIYSDKCCKQAYKRSSQCYTYIIAKQALKYTP